MSKKKKDRYKRIGKRMIADVLVDVLSPMDKEEFEVKVKKAIAELETKYYFLLGLGSGVVLGILGNFLASHWIEMLRGIVMDEWWWMTNVVAFLIVLVGVLAFIIWMFRQTQEIRTRRGFYEELMEMMKERRKRTR